MQKKYSFRFPALRTRIQEMCLAYWEEVNSYGTNPREDNRGEDPDGDGIPIEWEDKWGYDPTTWDDHLHLDPDNDGLENIDEYFTSQWGSDPFYKDIFVEVDWMQGHRMSGEAKSLVINAFARHNIALHIDDGCMGGGGDIISHQDKTAFYMKPGDNNDLWDYKWGNGWDLNGNGILNSNEIAYLHGHFNYNRWGIFHYCIFANDAETKDGSTHLGVSEPSDWTYRDDFIIGDSNWHKSIPDIIALLGGLPGWAVESMFLKGDDATCQAGVFMHELGHNLGLPEVEFTSLDYHSCMNYFYILHDIHYTDSEWGIVMAGMNAIGENHLDWPNRN